MNQFKKNKISANAFKSGFSRFKRRRNRGMVPLRRKLTISNDNLMIKCEETQTIVMANGQTQIVYGSGNTYRNTAASISNSNSWQSYSPLYTRFKIVGLALRSTRIANDATAMTTGVACIPVNMTFYPQYVSTAVSQADIVSNDQSFRIDSNVTTIQTKYYKFPDQFFESGSTGFGIWTDVASVAGQTGQVSAGNFSIGFTATTDKLLYQIRLVYYVVLGYKRQ